MRKKQIKIVLAIITLSLSYGFFEHYNFERDLEKYISDDYDRNHQTFQALLESENRIVKAVALSLANDKITKDSFLKDDPNILKKKFQNLKEELNKQHLVHEIHFFKPKTESFANISEILSSRHNVSKVRPDVSWVLKNKKASNHFITCRTYSGIRTVEPIFDKDLSILGSVSVGTTIENFPKLFKKLSISDEVMFINNKAIFQTLKPKYLKDFISNTRALGDYIISSQTRRFKLEFLKMINLENKFSIVKYKGVEYRINIFYFKDFLNKPKYRMVAIKDISSFYSDFYKELVRSVVIIILVIIIFLYLIILAKTGADRTKLKNLSILSQELFNQDFSSLKYFKVNRGSKDELDLLSYNIVDMGLSLERFYKNLQTVIDAKDRETIQNLSIDGLTKLSNRRELERFIKTHSFKTLIFLDIDNFSNINDFFGTEVGNSVLVGVAQRLREFGDENGFQIYRVGSDESAILCIDKEKDKTFLELLIENFSNINLKNSLRDIDINVDFTFGVSKNKDASIAKSDIALHEAKNKKLRYVVYDDSLLSKEVHERNIALSKKIRDAFKYDNLKLFYQPIYNRDREIVKYESLIRLKDGDRYLTPYHFLDYAKKTKDYFEITKIVVDKSFKKFRDIDISFSINLSADDIVNREISEYIIDRISKFPNPKNITIEILESEEIQQLDKILNFLKIVREFGVKIAIDDFGSGYSNFSYLLDIKPDYLKIDGSIIKGIATKEDSYLIAKSIVEFSKASNFLVIGEFIDSEEVFRKGKEMGIDMFQGYYLSMPLKDI